jgi:hypothetical protein
MSAAVAGDSQRRFCLEKVLGINPANATARQALARLGASTPPAAPAASAAAISRPAELSSPQPPVAQPLAWPTEPPATPPPPAQPAAPAAALTWPSELSSSPPPAAQPLAWPAEPPANPPPAPPAALTWPAELSSPQPPAAQPLVWPTEFSANPPPTAQPAAPAAALTWPAEAFPPQPPDAGRPPPLPGGAQTPDPQADVLPPSPFDDPPRQPSAPAIPGMTPGPLVTAQRLKATNRSPTTPASTSPSR